MDSKIVSFIVLIMGGFFGLLREYYYRISVKRDKHEESLGRNFVSWAIYFYLVCLVIVIVKLLFNAIM